MPGASARSRGVCDLRAAKGTSSYHGNMASYIHNAHIDSLTKLNFMMGGQNEWMMDGVIAINGA